ncbi:MAG: RpiB/LacA/LacB family sugar-phosphate isomerase [Myxococcota bacterium]|jgi:ribose 5-phosphate isomerase B|nr:RpiB/LacA/LacB family sugar-phosphate isomerase [Myxococcota bacterium]
MKIAICSDEPYPIHDAVVAFVEGLGHEVVRYGSLIDGREQDWVATADEAAQAIQQGSCDEGIFFCWTGTGITMAANKVRGIRAALCIDPETAQGARIWNHANVIGLSNRLTTKERALEILEAWFTTKDEEGKGNAAQEALLQLEANDSK